MSGIVLRPARAADGPVIASVQLAAWRVTYAPLNPVMVRSFDTARTAANWAEAAADPARRVRIAERDGVPVGFADSDGGDLDALYVMPEVHGQGVGLLLVEDALGWMAAAGFDVCTVWVAERNTAACAFYRHLGFRDDGGRDGWRGLRIARHRRATRA